MTEPHDDMTLDLRFLRACGAASLVGCVLLALIMALLSHGVNADGMAADQPICKAVATTDYPANARVAEWVGYPEKWRDMPAGLTEETPIYLYMDETIEAGYVLYFDNAKQELWVFPHWSFVSRGALGGTHDLCDVIVYALGNS